MIKHPKTCNYCGHKFTSGSRSRIYCSVLCRRLRANERRKFNRLMDKADGIYYRRFVSEMQAAFKVGVTPRA